MLRAGSPAQSEPKHVEDQTSPRSYSLCTVSLLRWTERSRKLPWVPLNQGRRDCVQALPKLFRFVGGHHQHPERLGKEHQEERISRVARREDAKLPYLSTAQHEPLSIFASASGTAVWWPSSESKTRAFRARSRNELNSWPFRE